MGNSLFLIKDAFDAFMDRLHLIFLDLKDFSVTGPWDTLPDPLTKTSRGSIKDQNLDLKSTLYHCARLLAAFPLQKLSSLRHYSICSLMSLR
jgi:hypothetical protein